MMDNITKRIDDILAEGLVTKARTQVIRTLNDKARKINNFAEKLGLEADISEVSSVEDSTATIEIQMGKNKKFKRSQVISVVVHDADDYVVWLPTAVTIYLDTSNHHKFSNLLDTKRFIRKLDRAIND